MAITQDLVSDILEKEISATYSTDETPQDYINALHSMCQQFMKAADSSGLMIAINDKYTDYASRMTSLCDDRADYRNEMRDYTELVLRLAGIPAVKGDETVSAEKSEDKLVTITVDELAALLRQAAKMGNGASWGDHTDSGIAWHVLKNNYII